MKGKCEHEQLNRVSIYVRTEVVEAEIFEHFDGAVEILFVVHLERRSHVHVLLQRELDETGNNENQSKYFVLYIRI